jgi:NADH:ubiquinone oxidoreductase subunit F (NADH-binding)/(2Fe-2S) ferredoxin/NAD-dependent dihydropyrimidine dehydrogenase PreA subunit
MTTMVRNPEELESLKQKLLAARDPDRPRISVCCGTGCRVHGSMDVIQAFRQEIDKRNLNGDIGVVGTGCHGFCEKGPVVVLKPSGIFYQRVAVEDAPEIVSESLLNGAVIDRLTYVDPTSGNRIVHEEDVPFYLKQQRLVLDLNGDIDPTNIEDYIAFGGYAALGKALRQMEPEGVIEEVVESGLRGRGGAGFPAGIKWRLCREADGDTKYIICNADEGDPGAYMDRSIMEGNPHRVLEGMIIGAWAIGAEEGYVYIRNEYPLAVENLRIAIAQAEEYGFLGQDILGSGFDFSVRIRPGSGAFVCGEETALMASIEDRIGEPRPRPPYPAQSGLWGKPTNINNVETWANVPMIIDRGGQWYSKLGTDKSKGTKIFSLVGNINNTGLVEVPMGATLSEIIYDIGGGIPGGKECKAVQLGGPSGGCVPSEHFDVPIDYESLQELGAIMGSGGMVVCDENTCMVEFARYFMDFVQQESCGKCVPCRLGTKAMLEVLTRITRGEGREGDIEFLEELGSQIKGSSLCGLGQTAPNPVLSTIRYFRDEYEAHISDKRCPSHVCKALITYSIDPEKCTGCGRCLRNCPAEAITGAKKEPHTIDPEKCVKCGSCYELCKFEAVVVE